VLELETPVLRGGALIEVLLTREGETVGETTPEESTAEDDSFVRETTTGELVTPEDAMPDEAALGDTVTTEVLITLEDDTFPDGAIVDIAATDDGSFEVEEATRLEFGDKVGVTITADEDTAVGVTLTVGAELVP
jgi:hypothetical protein